MGLCSMHLRQPLRPPDDNDYDYDDDNDTDNDDNDDGHPLRPAGR